MILQRITKGVDMTTLSNESGLYVGILNDALLKLRRRVLGLGVGAAAVWGSVAFIASLIVFAWVDVAVDLPGGIRLACAAAALMAAVAVIARLGIAAIRAQESGSVAHRLDQLANSRGQIATAVDLAGSTHAQAVTAGLAQLAVRRATEIISGISTAAAAPRKPLVPPISTFAGLVVFLGIVSLVAPRMMATQFLRFADPFGDHPPYSRITFAVDPGNTKVVYGGAVDVTATVNDAGVDRMELVLMGKSSDAVDAGEPLPMFPEGGGKWRATIANVIAPQIYLIRSGRARSNRFSIDVITVPKLTDVKFTVQLPEYTNRPPYEGPLPQNGLSGLAGTTVMVHAKSNRPLSGGQIIVEQSRSSTTAPAVAPLTVNMEPETTGASEVVGRFVINSSGKMTLGVIDVAGQPSTETLTASITLLKDEKPFVRLLGPKPESFATPDATIKVEALAEDDYGISSVSIFRGLNDSRMRPTEIPVPMPPRTQVPATLMLALSDYGLKPGDTVQLFARAADNDPAGAKTADSTLVTLHIVSQEAMDRMMVTKAGMETLQSKYAAAERRLEAADAQLDKIERELAKADPNSKPSPELQKKLAAAAAQMSKAAADIDKLSQHPLPFDIDHALNQQLKDLAKAVKDAADEAKKTAGDPGLSAAGALDKVKKIRKDLGVKKDGFDENATKPLEYLSKVFPLIEDQAKFLDLYAREKDLDGRMKSIKDENNPDDPQIKAQMRNFEDEQKGIRDDLAKLLDDIDSHVQQLPEDPKLDEMRKTAKDFADAVRASPANYEMQTSESSLENFQGTTGESFANAATQTLSTFIARCQGAGEQAGACMAFQPKLAAGLGNTVEQMLKSMGLSMGPGEGGVGGYSATRSSLANVGLYGAIPLRGEESAGQAGGDADHGITSNPNGTPDDSNNPEGGGTNGRQHASGQSDAPVPPQYKKRVGDYFQRVSDELSQ
jgi:hypothetical protein